MSWNDFMIVHNSCHNLDDRLAIYTNGNPYIVK